MLAGVAKIQPVAAVSPALSSGGLRVYAIGAGSRAPGFQVRVPMRRVLFLPSFDVAEILLMLATSVLLIAASLRDLVAKLGHRLPRQLPQRGFVAGVRHG